VKLYTFIDAQKAQFSVVSLCAALSVPVSSYYDWHATGRERHAGRVAARAELTDAIRVVHAGSEGTYGSPRIHDQLRKAGRVVSLRRVAETMADAGIAGISGREHSTVTTRRDRLSAPFPDLVARRFLAPAPDVVWYGDVSYIWITDKFWYFATVIDAGTKELLGWAFADHMRTELVIDALNAAVRRRDGVAAGVIFHSDRGSQYTSDDYGEACRRHGIRQSMGRRGVCYDNAAAESFFSTIKRELVDRYYWDDPEILRVCLFDWIERWYNKRRVHTSIGMRTPNQAYNDYITQSAA
jgi:transposase InsO family protein